MQLVATVLNTEALKNQEITSTNIKILLSKFMSSHFTKSTMQIN